MRLSYLDGLRGYAALTVVFGHAQMFYPGFVEFKTHLNPLWLRYLFNAALFPFEAGTFAVYVFFVLSGFVIAASASRSDAPLPLIAFKRYLRLTLPMIATALAAWFLVKLFPHATAIPAEISKENWIATIYGAGPVKWPVALRDVTWKTYWNGFSYIDPVLWTMQVELIGSLCIYTLYAAVKPAARPYVLAALGLFCANQAGNYLGFVLGTALYEAHRNQLLKPLARGWLPLLLTGMICGAFGQLDPLWRWLRVLSKAGLIEDNPMPALWSLSAALIVLSLLVSEPFQKLMSARPFQPLGRISFSLYLIHMPLLGTLLSWSYAVMLPHHSTVEIMAWEAGFVAIALLAALAMTAMIDEPVLGLTARIWSKEAAKLRYAARPGSRRSSPAPDRAAE